MFGLVQTAQYLEIVCLATIIVGLIRLFVTRSLLLRLTAIHFLLDNSQNRPLCAKHAFPFSFESIIILIL